MAAAYATLVSAMNIINNLHHHPRPPISLHIKQAESLTEKISFLLEFLQGYNHHRGYCKEADPLESRIADAAYAAEYAIESHIFDELTNNGQYMSYDNLYEALEKVIEDMASIEEEANQIQGRVGLQHQHQLPPDSSRSSSIPQQSSMVGADDVKRQMMDKLTSHCRDLQIIPIVGMAGSGIRQWFLQKEYQRNTRTITGKEPFKFAFTSGIVTKQDWRAWMVLTFVLNVSHENHYY